MRLSLSFCPFEPLIEQTPTRNLRSRSFQESFKRGLQTLLPLPMPRIQPLWGSISTHSVFFYKGSFAEVTGWAGSSIGRGRTALAPYIWSIEGYCVRPPVHSTFFYKGSFAEVTGRAGSSIGRVRTALAPYIWCNWRQLFTTSSFPSQCNFLSYTRDKKLESQTAKYR